MTDSSTHSTRTQYLTVKNALVAGFGGRNEETWRNEAIAALDELIEQVEALEEKPDQPLLNAARRLVKATDNAERNYALADLVVALESTPASEPSNAHLEDDRTMDEILIDGGARYV